MTSARVDQADHHKHMEFVQAVITRLANNSFLLKGWALTLVSALLGFAVTQDQVALAAAALFPALVFWLLDTYYLRQERAFRDIYKAVAAGTVTDFRIDPTAYVDQHSWRAVGLSISLRTFYGAMILLTCVVALILALTNSPDRTPPPPYEIRVTTESVTPSGTTGTSAPTITVTSTPTSQAVTPQLPETTPEPPP